MFYLFFFCIILVGVQHTIIDFASYWLPGYSLLCFTITSKICPQPQDNAVNPLAVLLSLLRPRLILPFLFITHCGHTRSEALLVIRTWWIIRAAEATQKLELLRHNTNRKYKVCHLSMIHLRVCSASSVILCHQLETCNFNTNCWNYWTCSTTIIRVYVGVCTTVVHTAVINTVVMW